MRLIAGAMAGLHLGYFTLGGGPVAGQSLDADEYEVKTAFVYNFAKFTVWPAAVFATPQSPVVLCMLAGTFFGPALAALQDKPVGQRRLLLREVALQDAGACHLLLVGRLLRDRLSDVARAMRGRPTLTIGDAAGFAGQGCAIGLVVVDGRVRFEVNLAVLDGTGIALSSQLLRLARLVENAP
jgi:hypothetical protein